MRRKCLLVSFFNSHNIGDRVIADELFKRYSNFFDVIKCSFEGALSILEEKQYNYSAIDYIKLCYGYMINRVQEQNEEELCPTSLPEDVVEQIKKVDIVIIGGGNMLMYDYYRQFLLFVGCASKEGIPVIVADIGVGPFDNSVQHESTCAALDLCQYVTFRDADSLKYAKKYCRNPNLFLAVDPCLLIKRNINRDRKYIAINIMDVSLDGHKNRKKELYDFFVKLGEEISKDSPKEIVLFSTVFEDYPTIFRLYLTLRLKGVKCKIVRVFTKEELDTLYSSTSFLVGMRMHSLILASGYGIDQFGIAWQKKVRNYFSIIENQQYAEFDDLSNIFPMLLECIKRSERNRCRLVIPNTIFERKNIDLEIIESLNIDL